MAETKANAAAHGRDAHATLTIEQLRKRYEELNKQQIEAGANYKTANELLESLKAAAKAEHGTDDLEALRAKLKEMEAENERKRSEYQAHLDKIEADLKEVETKFNPLTGSK
jgi:DNA repair exonuclease SbcCD ATPase subunit